jgi:hypothetical protein
VQPFGFFFIISAMKQKKIKKIQAKKHTMHGKNIFVFGFKAIRK